MSTWTPTEDEWRSILDVADEIAGAVDELRRLVLDGAATPTDAARLDVSARRLAAVVLEAGRRRPTGPLRVPLTTVSEADAARHRVELVDAIRSGGRP